MRTPWVEAQPSGRHKGVVELTAAPGTRPRRISKTFDFAYEAAEWCEIVERELHAAGVEAAAAVAAAPRPPGRPQTGRPARTRPITDPGSGPSLGVYAARRLELRAPLRAPATIENNENALAGIIRQTPDLLTIPVAQLTKPDVEAWLGQMVRLGIGQPTIEKRLEFVQIICRDALADGIAPIDATHRLSAPPRTLKRQPVLTAAAEARILAAAGPEARATILLGLDAGLRWQEALALDWADVHLGASAFGPWIEIRQTITRRTRRSTGGIVPQTKGKRAREIPLSTPRLVAAITALGPRPSGLLFTNSSGQWWDQRGWSRRVWEPLHQAASLPPDYTFHDLRHTCGSRLAEAGVPRGMIAEFLGHADERTTERYLHTLDAGRRHDLLRAALADVGAASAA